MNPDRRCDGMSRRQILVAGALSPLGVTLASSLRHAAAQGARRDTRCLLIWLDGGPSHMDTFDPKPEAPVEVRGPFGVVESSVPGVRICEHLPLVARQMHRMTLVRSLTHEFGNHPTGSQYLLTGNRPSPALEHPSMGSVLASLTSAGSALPPYIAIPDAVAAAGPGFLSSAFAPFAPGDDPSRPGFKVRDLSPHIAVTAARLRDRRELLRDLDEKAGRVDSGVATEGRDQHFAQALRLMTSPEARAAFDLGREAPAVRERYGRSRIGASCLLGRRLLEAGSRFVTVIDNGWDHHQQLARVLPDAQFPGSGKLPSLDRAVSALVTDLADRGQLDRTLVVLMGEFGRTPKLNSQGGRDHWPRAGFVLLAGGGTPAGVVIGATDTHGEAPVADAASPEDLAFTVLSLLGVDPKAALRTPDGRPVPSVNGGRMLPGIKI